MTEGNAQMKKPNPWIPEENLIIRAILGKFIEEAGEAITAASRCLIQGLDEKHPITGKANIQWLEEEFDDLENMIKQARRRFQLESSYVRLGNKERHINEWIELIKLNSKGEAQ